jgi:hypothetical protein
MGRVTTQCKESGFLNLVETHPVGLTSLVYLVEVLQAEKYEECGVILEIAREFGACESDVQRILADPYSFEVPKVLYRR